ncbi:BatA domain-containing protein [Candidatus Woesearchaeota archaeon]|nr:BatA domain-containing protein [Candidatus Woesearchaeota archaeon]
MSFLSFDNPVGVYAFGSVAFLILLYLIRPKLKDVKIPSIMFLMKDEDKARKSTFFKRFISSLLFFLQLLMLALLSFAVLAPVIQMEYDSTAENTVIVLDISASMKTEKGTSTRFAEALNVAIDNARGRTSIILAENRPLILLEGGSESKAKETLQRLKPKDTRSNIGDAILLAGELLKSNDGRVLVVSDFLMTEGTDPEIAKKVLEQRGITVDFVRVHNKAENIGFIDVDLGMRETKVIIKNFYDEDKDVSVEVRNEGGYAETFHKTVLARSVEPIVFPTMAGATRVQLLSEDDLSSDDVVYLTNPLSSSTRALLISNEPNVFIKNALEAGTIAVDVASPPVVPDVEGFDLVILDRFEKNKLLPGTMDDIYEYVQKGGALVIVAQNKSMSIDYLGMLPVNLLEKGSSTTVSKSVDNQFTKDVDFGEVEEYYHAEQLPQAVVIARAADESPVIAYHEVGDGRVLYYGILDDVASFKSSPAYPIFWNSVASFLMGIENMNDYNHHTGSVLAFENERVIETPSGKVTTALLVMDEAGSYVIRGQVNTANLLSDAESDISRSPQIETTASKDYKPVAVPRTKDVSISTYLAIIALVLLFVELVYIKYRGDV